jgi:hypothetical protein
MDNTSPNWTTPTGVDEARIEVVTPLRNAEHILTPDLDADITGLAN